MMKLTRGSNEATNGLFFLSDSDDVFTTKIDSIHTGNGALHFFLEREGRGSMLIDDAAVILHQANELGLTIIDANKAVA